jgi:hypothetical protein
VGDRQFSEVEVAEAREFELTFGKFKGWRLASVGTKYLQRLLKNSTGQDLLANVEKVLSSREPDPVTPQEEEAKPRDQMIFAREYFSIKGSIIALDEIRSLRPVRTPVSKGSYFLTHVVVLRDGCLGNKQGYRTGRQIWLTEDEAKKISEMLLRS